MGRNKVDNLDETGRKILEELKNNSRLSYREIGRLVGLSCSSVAERIKRMEDDGIIKSYTVVVDNKKLISGIHAIIEIKTHSIRNEDFLIGELPKIPSVIQFWIVTGDRDIIMETVFHSIDELSKFLGFLCEHGQSFSYISMNPHNKSSSLGRKP